MEFPLTAPDDRFNAKLRIQHPEFRMLIQEAEQEVNDARGDDEKLERLIEEHEQNMEDSIGDDCYLHEAALAGFVWEADDSEMLTGKQDYIWTQQSVFHAMRLIQINGVYKVVLQLTTDDYYDDEDTYYSKKTYFMTPESADVFEIFTEESVMEVIARHIEIGRNIITDPSFYNLSFEFQTKVLQEAAARLDVDLPFLENFGVAFDASRYVVINDSDKGDVRGRAIDQSMLNHEDRVQPRGEYRDCLYPELAYTEKAFKRIEEFDISGGSACIMLRDDEMGVTYLVPLDAIENHDDTYLGIHDQQDLA